MIPMFPDTQLFTTFLPQVFNPVQPTYGVQVDGALSIPITDHRFYQSPARWMQMDLWLSSNVVAFGSNPAIIGTKTCPVMYRLWADKTGSPPRPEYYSNYAAFVGGLAVAYAPWGIEIWNEPDVFNTISSTPEDNQQWYYGAWVDPNETDCFYRAGRRYGELVAAAYPTLHNLGVNVIAGALCSSEGTSLEFLAGALETCTPDYVSFHHYIYIDRTFDTMHEAVARLRTVTQLPLICTETAIKSWKDGIAYDTAALRTRQVDYLNWLKAEGNGEGNALPIWLWYAADNSWYNVGLKRHGEFAPAYYAWLG